MILIEIIAAIGILFITCSVIYLYYLLLVSLLVRERKITPPEKFDFLILIPAHNESKGLIPVIESINQIETIGTLRTIIIADNCTDDTADIGRAHNVEVLERTNPDERGKGFALEWAINQVEIDEFDAVVIIDADTLVDKKILLTMSAYLSSGYGAIQLNYIFKPSLESKISYLQYIASLTENLLFYRPRSLMNFHNILRGSGMAIRSDVLKRFPWDSHSLTEDVDYSIKLTCNDIKVTGSSHSYVISEAAATYQQAKTQKSRWASGTFALIADHLFPLLKRFLFKFDFKSLELAFTLFLLSRPFLIYLTILLVMLLMVSGYSIFSNLIILSFLNIILLIAYILFGFIYCENKVKAFLAMLYIPFYGVWFLLIQFKALLGFRKSNWKRTERNLDE